MELLLLLAVAYAGARGIEALTGTADQRRRHESKAAEETVKAVAAKGGGTTKKAAGPTEPGGTFVKAAPRTAQAGGKAALPVAFVVETGATMWKALGEGYRQSLPTLREQRRQRMAERAQRRQADKVAAAQKKTADGAAAKAGPPPAYPPKPTTAPTVPGPRTAPGSEPTVDEGSDQKSEPDDGRRPHLRVVPSSTDEIGDLMSSPSAIIPEIRTLDGLLNAFTLLNAMCQMRAEEADAVSGDDLALSNRLDTLEAELADLGVDEGTRAEIDELRDSIHAQSKAAADYGSAALDAAGLVTAAAGAAHKSHGGIAEAVQSSPIERVAEAGYYNR